MKNFLLLAFILITLSAAAQVTQVVQGTIKDEATGKPLAGANVVIKGPTNGGASTNDDGSFEIKDVTPGRYRV